MTDELRERVKGILDEMEYELTHGACIVDKNRVADQIIPIVREATLKEVENTGVLRDHRYITEGTIRQDETHYPDRCPRCAFAALKQGEK